LGGEKIDVIAWSDTPENLIRDALKPAEISRVEIVDGQNCNVWLNEDQRSLAIGKMGQNINLASRLCEKNIHLMQSEAPVKRESRGDLHDDEAMDLQELD
jgi:transcription termination/antitermination protein NusA